MLFFPVTILAGAASSVLTTTGTYLDSGVGSNAIGLATVQSGGFMFTTGGAASSFYRATITTQGTVTAANWHAEIWTDNAGSPGSQVGVDSDTTAVSGAADYAFTFSTMPTISASTNYWIIFQPNSGNPQMTCTTVANSGSYKSGRQDTVTSIADGQNDSSRDFKVKVEYYT